MSLKKAYTNEDIHDWISRVNNLLKHKESSITLYLDPKLDGIAVSLIYINGKLSEASTRGNGYVGLDVLNVIRYIRNVPHNLITDGDIFIPKILEVRGEVVIDKHIFTEWQTEGIVSDKDARSYVSGLVRRKTVTPNNLNGVYFIAYLVPYIDTEIQSHATRMMYIQDLGITINKPLVNIVIENPNDLDNLNKHIGDIESKRDQLPYQIDGVVIKYDNYHGMDFMLATAKYPIWGLAFKFAPKSAISKVTALVEEISNFGIFNPVVCIEPVQLGNTTVNKVNLFNYDILDNTNIGTGDEVNVVKIGDVSPQLGSIIKRSDRARYSSENIRMCWYCGGKTVKVDSKVQCIKSTKGKGLMSECIGRDIEWLKHYCKVMGISSLTKSYLSQLHQDVTELRVYGILHLYRLKDTKHLIKNIDEKTIDRILNNIQTHNTPSMSKLLYSLSIKSVGFESCKKLETVYTNLESMIADTTLMKASWLNDKQRTTLIDYLVNNGSYLIELDNLIKNRKLVDK
jgi:DNA ligase (NAD+)